MVDRQIPDDHKTQVKRSISAGKVFIYSVFIVVTPFLTLF